MAVVELVLRRSRCTIIFAGLGGIVWPGKFSMETGLAWDHLGSLSYQYQAASRYPSTAVASNPWQFVWVRVVGVHLRWELHVSLLQTN